MLNGSGSTLIPNATFSQNLACRLPEPAYEHASRPSAQRRAQRLNSAALEFATATEIVFGAGSRQLLPDRIRREGARALVVTGRSPARTEAVLDAVRLAGVEVTVSPLGHEPTLDDARTAARLARRSGSRSGRRH